MPVPQPNEVHRKLQALVGDWVGEEKIHPSPFDPQGAAATARVHNRLSLDGFVVVQDYEQSRNGNVHFHGHGVFSFDPFEKCYCMHWWDSLGMGAGVFRGQFENDVLTLIHKAGGGENRAAFDLGTPGKYRFKMDVSPDGRRWFPFLEGTYQRQD